LRAICAPATVEAASEPGHLQLRPTIICLRETLQRDIPAVIITGDISTVTSRNIAPTNCMLLNKPVESDTLISLINGILAAPRPGAERAAA
jgi:two-component system CheB/CheR fusion protein